MIFQYFTKDDYYCIKRGEAEPGRLVWAPIIYSPNSSTARILYRTSAGNWGLKPLDRDSFKSGSHDPIVDPIRLDIHEEALLVKAKKRPAILLSHPHPTEAPNARGANIRLKPRPRACWLVTPLYSQKHGPDFKLLVESLYFPWFFPMPANGVCPEVDSFVRFDQIQVVHGSMITSNDMTDYVMKDAEPWHMLTEALLSFLTSEPYGETYAYYRNEFLTELKKQGVLY